MCPTAEQRPPLLSFVSAFGKMMPVPLESIQIVSPPPLRPPSAPVPVRLKSQRSGCKEKKPKYKENI